MQAGNNMMSSWAALDGVVGAWRPASPHIVPLVILDCDPLRKSDEPWVTVAVPCLAYLSSTNYLL